MASSSAPTTRGIGTALAVIGTLLIANGAWYTPIMFSAGADQRFSETGGTWQFQAFYVAYLVILLALALLAPALGRLVGRTGRQLPGWLPGVLTATVILQAATVYAQAFVVPHLAEVAPAALDNEEIDLFAMSMMVIWVAYSLTWIAVAVTGAVRRLLPVAAAALIGVGALVIPVIGPGGSVLIGTGLVSWAVLRVLRLPAERAIQSLPAVPARA